MTYHVILAARAEADIAEIVDWLSERSTPGARAWLEALSSALASLERQPDRFARVMHKDFPDREVRQHIFKTKNGHRYWLVYFIEGRTVTIVHVFGAGKNR